jgi:UDP-N-acetylglucosamine 2-epimerase (non-hydrolysing)
MPDPTLRENTERPVTVTQGTNRVVGMDPVRILEGWREILRTSVGTRVPELWDGQAANRIVETIRRFTIDGEAVLARGAVPGR